MTNQTALSPMESKVLSFEENFNQVNAYKLNFKKEANFALQLLKANEFLRGTAQSSPESLENAITNIAAIGISLNPATKEAYLVPRNRQICLDISAIGLIKLATDSGSIVMAQAKLVYEKDEYMNKGVTKEPVHGYKTFGDRGKVVGVYVVAKTADGDFLTEEMTIEECHKIRDRSEAWKAYAAGKVKSCPWATDEGEMMKKTCIKRASKLWPKSERLDTAVQVLNEHEGIDFSRENVPHVRTESKNAVDPSDEQLKALNEKLLEAKRTEAELLSYLAGRFPKDAPESIQSLTGAQYTEAMAALDSIIEKSRKVTA